MRRAIAALILVALFVAACQPLIAPSRGGQRQQVSPLPTSVSPLPTSASPLPRPTRPPSPLPTPTAPPSPLPTPTAPASPLPTPNVLPPTGGVTLVVGPTLNLACYTPNVLPPTGGVAP